MHWTTIRPSSLAPLRAPAPVRARECERRGVGRVSHAHHHLDVTFLHNNTIDDRSPVTIVRDNQRIELSFGALADFVATQIAREKISQLEIATWRAVLGVKP